MSQLGQVLFDIDPMHSHSRGAFLLSVDKLFKECPHVYFWTFTWKHCHNDKDYAILWGYFIKGFEKYQWRDFGKVIPPGLIVVEVHPGGHGLHYHILWGGRVEINHVLGFTQSNPQYGIGRVNVQECYSSGIGRYLAKYLTKDAAQLAKGMRRWRSFGGFEHCRVMDLEVDSAYTRERKLALGGLKLAHFGLEKLMFNLWLQCDCYSSFQLCVYFLLRGDVQSAKRAAQLSDVKEVL